MLYGKITYSGGYYYFGGVSQNVNITGSDKYQLCFDPNSNTGEIRFKVQLTNNDDGIPVSYAHNLLHNAIGARIRELQEAHRKNYCIAFPSAILPADSLEKFEPPLRYFLPNP